MSAYRIIAGCGLALACITQADAAPLMSLAQTAASAQARYHPTLPPGGLDLSTPLGGATGPKLSDLMGLADGAVQKQTVAAPGGLATLDSNSNLIQGVNTSLPIVAASTTNATLGGVPMMKWGFNYNTSKTDGGQIHAAFGDCNRDPLNTTQGFYCQTNWLRDSAWGDSPVSSAGNFIDERPPGALGDGHGARAPIAGLTAVAKDDTGAPAGACSTCGGGMNAAEFDLFADGDDNTFGAAGNRTVVFIDAGPVNTDHMKVAQGLLIGGSGTYGKELMINGKYDWAALDLTGAGTGNGAHTIAMTSGQTIDLSGANVNPIYGTSDNYVHIGSTFSVGPYGDVAITNDPKQTNRGTLLNLSGPANTAAILTTGVTGVPDALRMGNGQCISYDQSRNMSMCEKSDASGNPYIGWYAGSVGVGYIGNNGNWNMYSTQGTSGSVANLTGSADVGLSTVNLTAKAALQTAPGQLVGVDASKQAGIVSDGNGGLAFVANGVQTGGVGKNGNFTLGGMIAAGSAFALPSQSRATILARTDGREGLIVNDGDDHVPVIYENGHWYPMQLGAALQ